MKPGWLLLLAPFAILGLVFELFGNALFDVRAEPVRPATDIPTTESREQLRTAFVFPTVPLDETPGPDVASVLQGLGTAARDFRSSEFLGRFDCDRLYDEVSRSERFIRANVQIDRHDGPKHLRAGLWALIHEGGPGLACDRIQLRKVVPLPVGTECIVYARHVVGKRSVPYRWWMVQRLDGWKAYDVEDLRIGLRLSHQAADFVSRGDDPATDLSPAIRSVQAAATALGEGQVDVANLALSPARGANLPREVFAVRCVLEGAIAAMQGRGAEALSWADRADATTPGLPAVDFLRASAHAVNRNWPEAALHARRYVETLGADAAACRILGTALREMGDRNGALDAFELGLQDDPTRNDLRAAVLALRGR